ncbi:cytochrome c oxidase assembly protein [Aquisalimonas sp.]|uniref:cytochrome c oxidase assembly protein n=1 Tax=unclassified Aquisalimonas TaxID=2644645 RepID=UPI0025C05ACC|nr:cytochrome c oxidase assembly protein [Aquisalimonas sp.]
MSDETTSKRHTGIVTRLVLVTVGMFGFGFALVPLYDVICDITGLNGVVDLQAADYDAGAEVDPDRKVTVEFVATVNDNRPWEFSPEVRRMEVTPGELYTVTFKTTNEQSEDTVSQIVPSVAPGRAGRHFRKTECFCFTEQPFEAGENRDMSVTFFIDPRLDDRTQTVTLSYTLFDLGAGDEPDIDPEDAQLHAGSQ